MAKASAPKESKETIAKVLAFLNGVSSAEQLTTAVHDDPNSGYGDQRDDYGIGLVVAERILEKREQIGGRYTDLSQVKEVKGLGADKLNDLIYSIKSTRLRHYEVTTDETWDRTIELFGDLHIKSGASLCITCELEMPVDGRIIVERGAILDINGGLITSRHVHWSGIEVHGNANHPHPAATDVINGNYPANADDHGVLLLRNGAILENARHAVSLTRHESRGANTDYSGGIILATDSSFTNVKRAVAFIKYDYDNISSFTNCIFEIDPSADRYFHFEPLAFVTLWAVRGVRFYENTFINHDPGTLYALPDRGRGIYSIDAQYELSTLSYAPGNPRGNAFINLTHAVESYATTVIFTSINIKNVIFENNYRSITMAGINGVFISEIHCSVGSELSPYGDAYAYGVQIRSCPFAWIEDSVFDSAPGSSGSQYGVQYFNCGKAYNIVYRNTFNGLHCGIRAIGDNEGLVIKYNEFDTTPGDFYIDRDAGAHIAGQLAPVQAPLPNSTDPGFTPNCYVNQSLLMIHSGATPYCPPPIILSELNEKESEEHYESFLASIAKKDREEAKKALKSMKLVSIKQLLDAGQPDKLKKVAKDKDEEAEWTQLQFATRLWQKGTGSAKDRIAKLAKSKRTLTREHASFLQLLIKTSDDRGLPKSDKKSRELLEEIAASNSATAVYACARLELEKLLTEHDID